MKLLSYIDIPNPHKTPEQAMYDDVTVNDDVISMQFIWSYTKVYCTVYRYKEGRKRQTM